MNEELAHIYFKQLINAVVWIVTSPFHKHESDNKRRCEACADHSGAMRLAMLQEFMHKRGVTHRDIKPENILLDQYGVAWPCFCFSCFNTKFQ
jgi:serine/threonine protein kinase